MKQLTSALMGLFLLGVLFCLAPAHLATAQTPTQPKPSVTTELAEVLKQVGVYRFGEATASVERLEALVRQIDNETRQQKPSTLDRFFEAVRIQKPSEREEVEKLLINALNSPATSDGGKHFIVKQLYPFASGRSAEAYGRLLRDDKLAYLGFYGLERLEDPKADRVLLRALETTTGTTRIGVIQTLGQRRYHPADARLAQLVNDPNPQVAQAATKALGKVGGRKAASTIMKTRQSASPELKPALTEAALECAKSLAAQGDRKAAVGIYRSLYLPHELSHVRAAAFLGLMDLARDGGTTLMKIALTGDDPAVQGAALGRLRELKDEKQIAAIAAVLPATSETGQEMLLGALSDTGMRNLAPLIEQRYRQSKAEGVQVAALQALGKVGQPASVPLLVEAAATTQGPTQDAAREALTTLSGGDVDQKILATLNDIALDKSTDEINGVAKPKDNPAARAELVRALAAREYSPAVPAILLAATDDVPAVQEEAFKALRVVGQGKHLPAVLNILVRVKIVCDRAQVERTIVTLTRKAEDGERVTAMKKYWPEASDSETRCSLVRVLGQLGDDRGLEAIQGTLNLGDAQLRDTALRTLAEWPTATPMPVLSQLASQSEQESQQVLALRGYIRMAGLDSKKPESERLAMYQQALALAKRPDEKRQVLALLGAFHSTEAQQMIKPYLKDKELKADAEAALKQSQSPAAEKK